VGFNVAWFKELTSFQPKRVMKTLNKAMIYSIMSLMVNLEKLFLFLPADKFYERLTLLGLEVGRSSPSRSFVNKSFM